MQFSKIPLSPAVLCGMVSKNDRKGGMDMKVLVTGGSGFLGWRTATYLETLGWQVFTPSHRELDIVDEMELRAWFRHHTPDVVIHTAAVSDTGLCQQKPAWSERINVTGAVNVAQICREYGAKLILCSSDQVYFGSTIAGLHREDEVLSPSNVYGRQKLQAEQDCLAIFPETVCLRLSWMYAQSDLPNQHSHFLTMLKATLADETKPLTWPIHDYRGLTDVDTVVKNLPKALQLEGGVWNFGAENDGSTYDTVKAVLQTLGMESALARLQPNREAFAENPRNISMDLTRLQSAGIVFPSTQEGLCQALRAEA